MKKKNLAVLLTIAAVSSIFGGCGSSTESNTSAGSKAEENAAGTENTYDGEVTTIYAATSANPRPFTYIDENGDLVGQNIELIQAVFEKLPQYELVIEVTDFSSIFAGLDSGRYQLGVNNFAMNDERKEKYIFTDPEMVNQYIVVANEGVEAEKIEDLTELAGYTYVGGAGNDKTTVVENYNKEHPDDQINISYSEADLTTQLQSVESGTYDFLIIDAPMYYGFYKPEFQLNLKEYSLENVKSATYSYFIVGKGNEQLAEDINKALAEVFADGTSTEIDIRYLGQDYTPGIVE